MRRVLASLRTGRGLSSFAAVALGWMVLVILEGAVVRATGSGAGCGNHWPLCNGDFIPQHPRIATVIEFTHRSMTGVCTALLATLIGWTFLAHPRGDRVRRAAVWTGLLLLTEAFLGAVLVKGGYVEHNTSDARVLVQCVHFTNTMLLLSALTLTWWWQRPHTGLQLSSTSSRRTASLALLFTLTTGATGSVAALADTLFPSANLRSALLADLSSSSPLLVRMRWMHPAASMAALVFVVLLAFQVGRRRRALLTGFLLAQFALGVVDVLTLAPVTLQVLHLFGADLLWITLVFTAADLLSSGRATVRSSSAAPTSGALAVENA